VIVHEKDTMLVTNTLQCSLFWMGKNDMVKDKTYVFKLATQKVKGQLIAINKVIDSSNLNSSENKNNIQMNEVAEVVIQTQEPIACDVFSDFHATGRFVVIDGYDVAGGGIITGSEAQSKNKPIFYDEKYAIYGHIFDEFLYDIQNHVLKQEVNLEKSYQLKDTVPLVGKSYKYPDTVDILSLKNKTIAQVEKNILLSIVPISEYRYKNTALINEDGFKIQISSQKELDEFLKDVNKTNISDAFLEKWLISGFYRNFKLINII